MNDPDLDVAAPARAHRDVPAERLCLRCEAAFESEGFGERICRRCKSSATWRTSVPTAENRGRQH